MKTEDLVKLIDDLNIQINAGNFEYIDMILYFAPIQNCEPIVMITILRTLFPIRLLLKHWNQSLIVTTAQTVAVCTNACGTTNAVYVVYTNSTTITTAPKAAWAAVTP